jgi:hypothetical protein
VNARRGRHRTPARRSSRVDSNLLLRMGMCCRCVRRTIAGWRGSVSIQQTSSRHLRRGRMHAQRHARCWILAGWWWIRG